MALQQVKFTFTPELVDQPIIYNMGKQFNVYTVIRKANLSHDRGWVTLEVIGEKEKVEQALDWAREQGVTIEVLEVETSS